MFTAAESLASDPGSLNAYFEGSQELLHAIADVLDVRTVFPRVSEIAKRMLPHDALTLSSQDEDSNPARGRVARRLPRHDARVGRRADVGGTADRRSAEEMFGAAEIGRTCGSGSGRRLPVAAARRDPGARSPRRRRASGRSRRTPTIAGTCRSRAASSTTSRSACRMNASREPRAADHERARRDDVERPGADGRRGSEQPDAAAHRRRVGRSGARC